MSNYHVVLQNKDEISNPYLTLNNYENNNTHILSADRLITFYKDYCETLYCDDSSGSHYIGEEISEYMPLQGEYIFTFDYNFEDRKIYNDSLIVHIVKCYQETIKDLYFISSTSQEFICAVLKTNNYFNGKEKSFKIKFQFPYCKVKVDFYKSNFYPLLMKKLSSVSVNDFFENPPLKSWNNILMPIQRNYPLYGSTINTNIPSYKLDKIYGSLCQILKIESVFDYKSHAVFQQTTEVYEDEDFENDYEKCTFYLPLFLSMCFCVKKQRIKEDMKTSYLSSSTNSETCEEEDDYNPDDLDIILELVEFLKKDRFDNQIYFDDIGKAFYNATEGTDQGLQMWKSFCHRSKNFDQAYCTTKYSSFEHSNITVKTIAWYSRTDDVNKYKSWHEKWCMPKLKQCVCDQEHVVVAEAFYRVFWLEYFCTGKKWFEFRRSKLVLLKDEILIRKAITDKFVPYLDKLQIQINMEKMKYNSGQRSSIVKEKIKDLDNTLDAARKLNKKLHTDSYRNSLVKSLKEYFYKENLMEILNKDPCLLASTNCVIELGEKEAQVRQGKPEDFITKKIGVSYCRDYSFEHQDIQDLLLYFRQVFPNQSINEHMKKDVSSMLYGKNSEKKFRMWIGDTNGSKSIFQKMIRTMLGQYYSDLPPEFFSAGQRGGGPSPELAQLDGSRVAFSAEPDDDISFKGARIKKITGGDSFFARSCNEDGGSIETTFKAIMVLNIVPYISGMDEATRKRFTMIPFEGRWLAPEEDPDLTDNIEEQIKLKTYKMDDRFEDNIPRLARALLWLSVNYYKKYRSEGLDTPPYIQKWMDDYWKQHDPYLRFIAEKLENPKVVTTCNGCTISPDENCINCAGKGKYETIDATKSLTASEIYPEFKRWLRENHPDIQLVPQSKLSDILSNKDKLGKRRDRRWWGVSLRKPDVAELI